MGVVFFNLIHNALDACPANSRIWLESLPNTVNQVQLKVSDDGPGIHLSIQQTLFQLGVTTKPNGSGFGLSFTRSRMHDLGGDILIEPKSPGACFRLLLPIHSTDKEVNHD